MWSVVAFDADNSVEVVPSNWFGNNVCAWPKRNWKSYIDNQVSPNEKCFRYLNARKLGKDLISYKYAEEKANLGRLTSDLSTNESSQENVDTNKPKLKRKVSLDKVTKDNKGLWSPDSADIFDDSDVDPLYSPPVLKNNDQGELSSPKHSSASLPVLARKKLDFDICSSGGPNKIKKLKTAAGNSVSHNKPLSTESQSISYYYSDPRKRVCLSVSPSTSNKIREFKNADQSKATSDSIKHTEIISTSSSPFKVSRHDENDIASTSQTTQNKKMNNNSDTIEKMNRNVLSLKYEIRSLHEKVDKLDEIIRNFTVNNNVGYNRDVGSFEADSFQTLLSSDFPLEDENALQSFENKLLDNSYRLQMVTELSRYVRNTLPSTVRSIMRFLFKDSLLQEYSYKGQKKKKVFSTLGVTSIIFDAVKNMKRYHKYDKIDVEQPMKIFIAGAKFRDNNKISE